MNLPTITIGGRPQVTRKEGSMAAAATAGATLAGGYRAVKNSPKINLAKIDKLVIHRSNLERAGHTAEAKVAKKLLEPLIKNAKKVFTKGALKSSGIALAGTTLLALIINNNKK